MDNKNLKQLILKTLKSDEKLWNKDKTELNQTLLLDLIEKIDKTVIGLLLQEKELRDKFFVRIKEAYVFKTNDFRFFMEENKIENSYTAYKNRIGITDSKNFLKDTNDVVLDFPYKDCVLEGGQSTEDGKDTYFEYDETVTKTEANEGLKAGNYNQRTAKRKEIFFNSVLAHDEIDRLFDPKALVNWKRFTKDGEQKVEEIKRSKDGNIKENLIIKGNNLLGLYSLKKQFAGKVKLIYIDPPYNTGSDSFVYNDNFNRSTWLTFMKNRLEIAKQLLSSSGVFLVQCSFHQFAYLKILMDNIFEKHLCDFNIKVRHPDRVLTGDKDFNDIIEYILIYSNDKNKKMPFVIEQKTIDDYSIKIELNKNEEPEIIQCAEKTVEVYTPEQYKIVSIKPSKHGLKKISIRGSIREKNSSGRFFVKYLENLKKYPPNTLFKVPNMGDDELQYRFFYSPPQGKKNGGYYQGMPTSSDITKKKYANFYNFEKEYNNVSKQGDVEFRNGKKPEELLKFLIKIFTNKEDIVLDYHLGSGTTCAVAHKMGRQYIGLEQLQNQIFLSLNRMTNVINSDQTGISKDEDIKWQGGGDFIYFELAKWNETAKEKILNCENLDTLISFFDEMYERYFLNYNIKIKEFREKVIKEEEFKNLGLDAQKKMFIAMLDNNQMYVNKTEITDKKFGINENNQNLTNQFYNSEK